MFATIVHTGLAAVTELAGSSARFFYCALCRNLAAICLRCDRGHRYCSSACAITARRRSLAEANKRYAATLKGGMARAQASRRYRSRINKVIDHGSLRQLPNDLLSQSPAAVEELPLSDSDPQAEKPVQTTWRCCGCGHCCPDFFRWDFLRRRAPRSITRQDKRGAHGDHPP